jgi:hypothetical protein
MTVAQRTLAALLLVPLAAGPLAAQDAWNPFRDKDEKAKAQRGPVISGTNPQLSSPRGAPLPAVEAGELAPPAWGTKEQAVDRGELQPVLANDSSGLPLELWQGLDMDTLERHVERLGRTVPSYALQGVWRRVWMSSAPPPGGGRDSGHFLALKLEALYRSGQIKQLREALAQRGSSESPVVATLEARLQIGLGDRERGCGKARQTLGRTGDLPKPLRIEAVLLAGYCAAASGDGAATGLAAELAHEQQSEASLALSVLDALASGGAPKLELPRQVSLLDYRFLELAKQAPVEKQLIERAEPALLAVLALDASADAGTRVAAAEAATRVDAIGPQELADAYRAMNFAPNELGNPASAGVAPHLRRALLFKAAELERLPAAKVRALRALLDEGRRAGIAFQTAALIGSTLGDMRPAPDVAWFAESAAEALLAAGDYGKARAWAEAGSNTQRGGGASPWLAIIDLADPSVAAPHSRSLAYVEPLATAGRLPPEALHRIVTVFDSLDFQIPVDLWQLASRTPQPATGHLPDTGVLSRLQDAAQKKEIARALILSLETLGPQGPQGAHMIALGDTLKALKRAGLDADARRLGVEAIFALWPRTASN